MAGYREDCDEHVEQHEDHEEDEDGEEDRADDAVGLLDGGVVEVAEQLRKRLIMLRLKVEKSRSCAPKAGSGKSSIVKSGKDLPADCTAATAASSSSHCAGVSGLIQLSSPSKSGPFQTLGPVSFSV